MKVFIADNLALIVDPIFAAGPPYNGIKILFALYAFAFQIFCDFAGYSNIARGLGKCMGFDIMVNFNLPYFSTNPREFWQRWHISLSTWLRDYLYIPLGGNRKGSFDTYRNLAITMLLGGLWHGAAWTFIIWGAYQGALLIAHRLFRPLLTKIPVPKSFLAEKIWFFMKVLLFFHLVCFGWLIFRAQSIAQVCQMIQSLMLNFKFIPGAGLEFIASRIIFYILILVTIQIIQFSKKDLMFILKSNVMVRAAFYVICFYLLTIFGVTGGNEFIYFQF